jgi:DNA-binding SARP family transcriptional activator/tetratricopeptide (TPR) repeat protein
VRLGILGPVHVLDDAGGEIRLAVRQRTLLAALLVHVNHTVPVPRLTELVWDGAATKNAERTVRSYVVRLRHDLGPVVAARVLTRGPGYLIRLEPAELDALEFEALCRQAGAALGAGAWKQASAAAAQASALWRDAPLLDVPSQLLREQCLPRLEQLRLQAAEDGAEARLRLGEHDSLVPELRELAGACPLREKFHIQLMTALARAGRRAEALAAYQHARKVLVAELGIEPGPELRAVHECVLAGGSELAPGRPGDGLPRVEGTGAQTSAAAVVPRHLPSAPGHFTGRQDELLALAALPNRPAQADTVGTVVISAIDGMAGIGKTALAIHAAHRLAERFPGGQLFVDLHGYTRGHLPRTADQALDFLLRALGVPPERIPIDGELAAALYRQRLAETRTLIVLDNAATEAQVRPLLPGTGSCLVLITSRLRLKGLDDAQIISLDLLAASDAVALLRAVAGPDRIPPDDPLAGEIAGLCGYLPLALRIAASLLRHRPAWGLEQLAGQLRDQRRRVSALSDGERGLPAVFDLSYLSLDEQHRRLWRRLGLIPGPDLDAYAAAALAEVAPARAAGLLEDLVDHNLLSAYAPGRYRLHDLLRAHARTLAAADPAPESEAAMSRLLRYYAHTARSASIPIARYPRSQPGDPAPAHTPALPDPDAARAWLRAEHPNLEASFTHAHTEGLDGHVIALAAGLAEILLTDGPWTRAMEIHQVATKTAERSGHPIAHATALNDFGRMRYLTGDYPGADDVLNRALELYRALGHRHGEANVLTDLGYVRHLTGDYPGAEDVLNRALELCHALGDHHGEANALTELGHVRHLTGDYPGADDAHTRALELYRALGHRDGEANALTNLGLVRYLTADYPGAGGALARALELFRALGHRHGEANALTYLGRVWQHDGDLSRAGDAHMRALELYRALGHRLGEANALTNLGLVRYQTGDLPEAGNALARGLELYRALGHRGNEAWALNHYAATLAAAGQRTRALALYQQALAMNRELNKPDDEALSLEGIGEHHLATGDPAQGTAHLHQALEIYRRLGMAPDIRRLQHRLDGLTAR